MRKKEISCFVLFCSVPFVGYLQQDIRVDFLFFSCFRIHATAFLA